ncbi:DUF3817 domain-containing protein [Alysiella filiformis]|uniref:Integral membrane protein n=1 Tax=Alysiella filiformis DSM 16848 TaxID=1120981 RepID=A0A286EFX0_9NEIS|nr:DUF3817 domain-containing protein [Alysiella filiformis]QMT31240.1 DUF3817 domain-containing protein [Alysiella filiformis]UBQ55759.1 DUF3817 domain-containing protein [Alysiella filiformis DSM 16848]SOD69825.1 integral membrane protein [Alysiella filiformis DSM 16848]
MSTPILRVAGILEGISCLALFGFAMPMKYVFDNPEFIRPTGMTHGVLFLAFLVVLLATCHVKKWSLGIFGLGLIAAIIPFGTFVFDHKIKKLDTE